MDDKTKNAMLKLSDTISLAEQKARIENSRNSYMQKADFIELISKLSFDTIETAKIHFNTSYEYIPEKDGKPAHIKNYGFDIDIY